MLVDATVKLRNSAGTLLQDLSTGGYGVGPVSEPGSVWRRSETSSQYVDGSFLISAAKEAGVLTFSIRIEGDDWDELETRRAALVGWLDAWSYKVEVYADGVSTTYVARVADMIPEPLTGPIVANVARQFSVSIPVQPNPVVS